MRRLSICCLKFIFLLCVVEFVLSEEQIFFLWQRTNGSFSIFASVFQESLRIQCLVKLSALTEVLYKHLKISHWNRLSRNLQHSVCWPLFPSACEITFQNHFILSWCCVLVFSYRQCLRCFSCKGAIQICCSNYNMVVSSRKIAKVTALCAMFCYLEETVVLFLYDSGKLCLRIVHVNFYYVTVLNVIAPLGKRGWKMFYATLRDMVLHLHIDEHGFKRNQLYTSATNAIHIHHSLATKATDYQKKNHVFRLQTADLAQYLIQTRSVFF